MSAETTVLVSVLRTASSVIEVSAVTLEEAIAKAKTIPGVVAVLWASYPFPEEEEKTP